MVKASDGLLALLVELGLEELRQMMESEIAECVKKKETPRRTIGILA